MTPTSLQARKGKKDSAWSKFCRWIEIGIWYQESLGCTPEEAYEMDKQGINLDTTRRFLKKGKP